MGNEDDSIPLADTSRSRQESELSLTSGTSTPGLRDETSSDLDLVAPQRTQDPSRIRGTGGPPENDHHSIDITRSPQASQAPLPLTRPQRWAASYRPKLRQVNLPHPLPLYRTTHLLHHRLRHACPTNLRHSSIFHSPRSSRTLETIPPPGSRLLWNYNLGYLDFRTHPR